jgi:two-component system, NarL family, sensor histidine kinase DesK
VNPWPWFPSRSDRWGRGRPPGRGSVLAGLVWLGFIVVPIVDAITNRGSTSEHWLAILAAVAFTGGYVGLVLTSFDERSRRLTYALCGLLLALTVILTLADRSSWGFLFTYCAACVPLVVPPPFGFPAVVATSLLAVLCTRLGGAGGGAALGYGASTVGIGLLLTLLRDLRDRNRELHDARAELARSAVVQERERFARDLHDLLGHSLSVIAIKAELARRLLPDRPDQATVEVAEVEQVARQALGEVRDAVSGYRQPTLNGELRGARMALLAAGIEADVERPAMALDPEVEAVLAWAVREGATNVIRHSGARHCTLKVSSSPEAAGVEVLDDGAGSASANGRPGNGLAGLTERAESLRGGIEAGTLPGGGFRLAVSLPVAAS